MEITYTKPFIKMLEDPTNFIRIFSCNFLKVDNSYTGEALMHKVRVIVDNSIDRLNDNAFIIELGIDAIKDSDFLVDGVQFGTYNKIELLFDQSINGTTWTSNLLAGYIDINKGNTKLFDYARNFIYLDLSVFPVNAKIILKKVSIDPNKDPMHGVIIDHKHKKLIDEIDDSTTGLATTTCSFKAVRKIFAGKTITPARSLKDSIKSGIRLDNLVLSFE